MSEFLTARLLNSAALGITLAVLVWMLLRLVGRQSAAARFAVWFSTLLAILAFPFFSGLNIGRATNTSIVSPHREFVLSSHWAVYLFGAWLIGAFALILRLGWGVWRMGEVRRKCNEVDIAQVNPRVARILATSRRHRVKLCTSGELKVPSAIGLFRPAVVFPDWLLPRLSDAEVEMIVRHEMAHLSRWDDWTNLLQKLVKALLFFHPAVWWIESRLTLEREIACDDAVLLETVDPRAYAASLISFAEKLHCGRAMILAQSLVSRMHQLSLRVAEILRSKPLSHTGFWKPVLAFGSMLSLALAAAPYAPQLVAFRSQPTAATAPESHLASAIAHSSVRTSVVTPVALGEDLTARAKVIPLAFHNRKPKTETPTRKKDVNRPLLLRTHHEIQRREAQPVLQRAVFVMHTQRYDHSTLSGTQVWRLCVWQVQTNDEGQVQEVRSTIVVTWI